MKRILLAILSTLTLFLVILASPIMFNVYIEAFDLGKGGETAFVMASFIMMCCLFGSSAAAWGWAIDGMKNKDSNK